MFCKSSINQSSESTLHPSIHLNTVRLKGSEEIKTNLMSTKEAQTSNSLTLMQLLKGNIGTGILAMPCAFANAGLIFGTMALPLLGIIALHCMHLLVDCHNKICLKLRCITLEYQDVAEEALKMGPHCLRNKSSWARRVVISFLLITQFGFCCVYSLFVATNLSVAISTICDVHLPIRLLLLLELPFMIVFNNVREWKHLALASTVANILQSTGLVFVFYDLCSDLPPISMRPAIVDPHRLPLYFGIAIYAFEGIGLVLPLRKEMRKPSALQGFFGVLNTGMTIVMCLYTGIGFFGYLKYGQGVEGSITMSWPPEIKYAVVQLMFSVAIFLSYGLQFYVPLEIMWPWFVEKFDLNVEDTRTTVFETVLRSVLVSFTFLIAAMVPELDTIISLVGALSSSCLALIFPPLIDIFVRWNDEDSAKRSIGIIKNVCIMTLGVLGFITGTYASSLEIMSKMSTQARPPVQFNVTDVY
ncbi:proton-coupled amino acid transporter 1-like isoform X1 [Brevipalpus obovatus]|uniref:proton-coupled amino acid transporter 1-like isoform X1 n=1 Tax=Brevipalpus obovatus TaxID=246614 RepID=UPI003D9E9214